MIKPYSLFKLEHAGEGVQWVELPQKLKIPKYDGFVAFLVPDSVASCTIN